MSDEAPPRPIDPLRDPEPSERPLQTDDELAAEGLLALRAEAPSAASKQQLLAGLGLADGSGKSRSRRRPFRSMTEGLALGLGLGLVLVVLRLLLG